jgi:hypothetical protein
VSIFPPLRLVVVESPYAATEYYNLAQHREYLRLAMADCAIRGEAPMASHHLLPEILQDDVPHERALGIAMGYAWGQHAAACVVYSDLGVSPGMEAALAHYKAAGKPIEWRVLDWRLVRQVRAMAG